MSGQLKLGTRGDRVHGLYVSLCECFGEPTSKDKALLMRVAMRLEVTMMDFQHEIPTLLDILDACASVRE